MRNNAERTPTYDELKARIEALERAIKAALTFMRDTLPSSEHGQRVTFEGREYILFDPEDWENFERLLEPWAREALGK